MKSSLILRNHGLLTVGATIADAFLYMYNLQKSCEIQVLAQAGGGELISVHPAILAGVEANIELVLRGMGGNIAWPALLRRLDRLDPSYRD
jgi:ribulose-5-phosphate 4-epimerase/fuculose-1-phosphate aldolase